MQYCRIGLGILFTAWLFCFLHATITTITSLSELLDEEMNSGDLLIWDIDEVIVCSDVSWWWNIDFLRKFERDDQRKIAQYRAKLYNYRFVEASFLNIFHALNSRGVHTLALTSRKKDDPILNQFFNKHHISFSLKECILSEPLNGLDTCFDRTFGILFSGMYSKGSVLKDFCLKAGYRPQRIIFVDDILGNCQSVLYSFSVANPSIPCKCFFYNNKIALDEQLALLQAHCLLKPNPQKITDEEAPGLRS